MVRHVNVLHVCAVEGEARGLPERAERLVTGVGPAAAAARLARRLALGPAVDLVIVSGVAGVLPRSEPDVAPSRDARSLDFPLEVGDVVLVRRAALVDEGVIVPGGFVGLRALGLPCQAIAHSDPGLVSRLSPRLPARLVDCATVSTGSGTDTAARDIARRLHEALHSLPDDRVPAAPPGAEAMVETMESAALALACGDAGVPWIELRAISNRTGDRARSGWDLQAALAALSPVRERLHQELAFSTQGAARP